MCDQTILENGGTLKSVPDCHKNQKMCNKAVDNYHHALAFFFFFFFFFFFECYKTQKICDKAVKAYPSTINLFLNIYDSRNV